MLHSVMTGEPAFRHVHGATLYDYFETHWQEASVFHAAMRGFSAMEAAAILQANVFPSEARFIDVGGGEGAFLAALLQAYPRATGMVLDLESAAHEAEQLFARHGLKNRAHFITGDFFRAAPEGGDVYILKSIMHNWQDDRAIAILRNCHAAMTPGARLLVIERVIPAGHGPSDAKLFDINMLVAIGGQERSEAEYGELLAEAGFRPERAIATASPLSLIEATPRAISSPKGRQASKRFKR
jgi:SAM-dependent methyltransferase